MFVQLSAEYVSPFSSMRRLIDDLDRTFDDWTFGRRWISPVFGREPIAKRLDEFGKEMYLPNIEVVEKNGDLIVRADLPGIKKEDVHVEIHDDVLVIKGERKQEEEEKGEGYYRSERTYGSFYRSIPISGNVKADEATATFKDGVLEVTMKVNRKVGRKVEVK
jgi:HSP20 family protein